MLLRTGNGAMQRLPTNCSCPPGQKRPRCRAAVATSTGMELPVLRCWRGPVASRLPALRSAHFVDDNERRLREVKP